MSTCRSCGGEFAAGELVRHERPGCLVVHCPARRAPLGRSRRRGGGREPGRPR